MTTLALPASETTLQREGSLFKELFLRLMNALLNRIFDLKPERAARRMSYLVILLLLSGFLFALRNYPLILWAQHIQEIFLYLFNSAFRASYIGNPFASFFLFALQALTDPRTFQYLPIFLAPFFIALQCAAIYLADIFEIEDVTVARKFISEVALSGSDETIRITQGDISDEHKTSPNYLIGGPGKVVVDIDSVALFEKPDGATRVIGPTGKEPGGKATLEGFERFRQAIDLRDHFIELRDQDSKSSAVKSRSLDGVPIAATDVRFMFSVHRDGGRSNTENPYPFSGKAIEQLIYKATSRVTPDLTNPSTFEFSWVNNMISLIRSKLGGFMSERNLTVYLANIGTSEYERVKDQEEKITEQIQKLAPATQEDIPKGKAIKPPPEFTPRYKITNLFAEFADEFTKSAHDRGVKLHWIGVGTWNTPIELVTEKHLEAWKLSRENLAKGSKEALESYENEAILLQMAYLIQDVPVDAYQKALNEQQEHKNAMQALLLSYRQQLINAKTFILAKGEMVPDEIENAIKNINKVFGTFIGSS